jgi:hypothetical protein
MLKKVSYLSAPEDIMGIHQDSFTMIVVEFAMLGGIALQHQLAQDKRLVEVRITSAPRGHLSLNQFERAITRLFSMKNRVDLGSLESLYQKKW